MVLGNERWCAPVDSSSARARVGRCLELEFRESKELDDQIQHARGQWPADIEDACGEYRRPLSFQRRLFGQPPSEVHGDRSKLEAKIQQKSAQKA